jgi:hypothetical protein
MSFIHIYVYEYFQICSYFISIYIDIFYFLIAIQSNFVHGSTDRIVACSIKVTI